MMKKSGNLALRVLTSVVAAVYLAVALRLGGWYLLINIALVTGIGVFELTRALRRGGATLAIWPPMMYAVLMVPAYYTLRLPGLFVLLAASACFALCALVLRGKAEGIDVFATTLSVAYPALPFSLMLLYGEVTASPAMATTALTLAFCISFGADVAAYFAGHAFGRHKLTPYISPNKTVEGAAGGLLGGAAVGVIVALAAGLYDVPLPWWEGAIIGFVGAFWSEVGDLAASAIKRFCHIKDYGNLFPGHGGLLDRLDGVAFNIVWVLAYFLVRGALRI